MKPVRRTIKLPDPATPTIVSEYPAGRLTHEATCADDGGLSLSIGDRVTLAAHVNPKPLYPCGNVESIDHSRRGALVKHDDGNVYGWAFSELVKMDGEWF